MIHSSGATPSGSSSATLANVRQVVDVVPEFDSTASADKRGLLLRSPISRLQPTSTDSELPSPPELRVGDVLQARYRYQLLRHLGKGAFGTVYVAACLDDDSGGDPLRPPNQVAIKVLGSARHRQTQAWLKRELAPLRSIQHDRIPKLFDWCLSGDTAFVVLEYFPDDSLAGAWSELDHGDEAQTWRLLSDLLSALNAAHRASILHLDVKPSNVLLDGLGGFVLTDFGTCQGARMSEGLLSRGRITLGMGTQGYRAPEQERFNLNSLDLRTDLWGLGATAWALYTGIDLNRRPEMLTWIDNDSLFGLKRLSDVRRHCPQELENVIMSLLYVDPRRRPGGAAEVRARVKAAIAGLKEENSRDFLRRRGCSPEEVKAVISSLIDPLWASVCQLPGFERYFARFEDGEILSRTGQCCHHTTLLLSGTILVECDGQVVRVEDREGTMLASISTLTGVPVTATFRAKGPVWACVFNEAELEQLITCNPAVAVRMLRNMALRIASGPPRNGDL